MSNTETFTAEIKINDRNALKKVNELNAELKRNKEALNAMTREGSQASKEAIAEAQKRISELSKVIEDQTRVAGILKKTVGDLSKTSYKELKETIKALKKELQSGEIEKGSEKWKLYASKIRECKEEMNKFSEAMRGDTVSKGNFWSKLNKMANDSWFTIRGVIDAVTGLSTTIRQSVDDYATMEQEMANVRKYTGQTAEEVEQLNEMFKKTDTRTSREELNQLAGAAGRLGITSSKQIYEFVDAADKIGVALGDDLGEEAVDTIGKLAIAFGESDRLGLRGAMLATGSALNEIVQNSSAQAQPVVEFTKALSGVGQQAHMTQAEIMGFASALDQNNQEMATSSTVMSQLITKMYQNPAKFASMAGLEVKKFKELVKTDMNEALISWFQASQKLGDMSVLAGAFDNLGMDGTRAVGVLSTLAGHIDQVVEAQNVANKAYNEANSVIKEFNVQNETVQAQMDKAKKQFKEMTIELGERLQPVVAYTISSTALMTKGLATITSFLMEHTTALISLASAYAAYIVISKADIAMTTTITGIKSAYGRVVTWLTRQQTIYTTAMVLQRDAVVGCAAAQGRLTQTMVGSNFIMKVTVATTSLMKAAWYALTFQFTAAKRALVGFNVVMSSNPWGAAATIILSVVAAVVAYIKITDKSSKAFSEQAKKMKELTEAQKAIKDVKKDANDSMVKEKQRFDELNKVIHDNRHSIDDRKKAILAMRKIVPDYHGSITKEGKLINDNTKALNKYISKLKAVSTAQAAFDKLTELNREKLEAELEKSRKQTNVNAVNREIARGTKSGKYRQETKYYYSAFEQTTGVEDNDALKKKKEELRLQQQALSTADDRLRKINSQIKAVEKFVQSSKDYKDAYTDIITNKDETIQTVTPGYYKTEQEKNAEKTEREKSLKEQAESAKAERDKQLAEEMVRYRKGETMYSDFLDAQHRITLDYYEKIKSIYGENSKEYSKLLVEKEKEENKYLKEKNNLKARDENATIERMERDHRLQMDYLDAHNKTTYQNDEILKESLFQSEIDYMKDKRDLYNQGSKEWNEWSQKIEDTEWKHKLELEENYMKKLQDYRKEYSLMSAEELEAIELQSVQTMYETLSKLGKMSEEEYLSIVQNIKQHFAEIKVGNGADKEVKDKGTKALDIAKKASGAGDKDSGNDIVSSIGEMFSSVDRQDAINKQLKLLYEQDAIDYATYEEAKRQNSKETAELMLAEATNAAGQISQMLGSVSSYMQACTDIETAKITKNYQAQIDAAGNSSKKREKLEKERDEKIRKAKSKANKKAMVIEMAQAMASTALAAINAYSSAAKIPVTGWIMAPIAAGMATAAGMLQIATIKKQQQAQEAGYYSGGYTGGRNYRKEAGVVHEGEFVANHKSVNNPQLLPFFDLIDRAQRNNIAGSLTAQDVTNVMGGPASTAVVPIVNVQTDMAEIRENLNAVSEAVNMLNETLQVPIKAQLSMQELDKDYKRYQNLLKSK